MLRRRRSKIALGIVAALLVALVWVAWPGKSTFTVSPETTYVTGPLDKDGYVDYVTALNERLSQGVAPENNANVLIWQALGPRPEGSDPMPEEYWKWLGIAPPPEGGEYFIVFVDYLKKRRAVKLNDERARFDERLDRAGKSPWTPKEEPEISVWLQRNEKALAIVIEATQRPEFYHPLVPSRTGDWSSGLLGASLANVQSCRELARALCCRAMLRVSDGKFELAWQDLLACHRLGRQVARRGPLIQALTGLAIEGRASAADLAFLSRAKFTSNQAMARLQDLQKLPPIPSVADCIDLTERLTRLNAVMIFVRHGRLGIEYLERLDRIHDTEPPTGNEFIANLFTLSVDCDAAMKRVNHSYNRGAAAIRLTDRAARQRELASVNDEIHNVLYEIADLRIGEHIFIGAKRRGDMIGGLLIRAMHAGFDTISAASERQEQRLRNVYLAFALAAYRADHQRYPAKLDELAPKYIDAIPDDLFSGKPLIYKLDGAGYLLYSVGPNGVDEAGRGSDDEPRGDDLSIRMPAKK
jgi:hypothetical protein